jgi:hypothetical protein
MSELRTESESYSLLKPPIATIRNAFVDFGTSVKNIVNVFVCDMFRLYSVIFRYDYLKKTWSIQTYCTIPNFASDLSYILHVVNNNKAGWNYVIIEGLKNYVRSIRLLPRISQARIRGLIVWCGNFICRISVHYVIIINMSNILVPHVCGNYKWNCYCMPTGRITAPLLPEFQRGVSQLFITSVSYYGFIYERRYLLWLYEVRLFQWNLDMRYIHNTLLYIRVSILTLASLSMSPILM